MINLLNIQELLTKDKYIIPIYQRHFAWGRNEIEPLLQGMYQAFLRGSEHYYVGSMVVAVRENGVLEVIDGQQRLTAFTLLAHFLRTQNRSGSLNVPAQPNMAFEHRVHFAEYLWQPEKLPEHFQAAWRAFENLWDKQYDEQFVQFIGQQVYIIRTQVPEKTDLNHYFEIMNTRGEQLEKHEILKARLLSRLAEIQAAEHERQAFSAIWDACSDMNRYMVLGVPKQQRMAIFGKDYQAVPLDSATLYQAFENQKMRQDTAYSIAELLNKPINHHQFNDEMDAKSDRFHAVIDFPNFLMHVARIYVEHCEKNPDGAGKIALDAGSLLETLTVHQWNKTQIDDFLLILCQCRYVFDRYIIKTDTTSQNAEHWTLDTVQPQAKDKGKYQYNNTFGHDNEAIVMLLSMFHVSHPSRLYKNWLYGVLRYLQKNKNINAQNYRAFLEELSDRYYFGYYGDNQDFFSLITNDKFEPHANSARNEILHSGTHVPNFIFNRLDYLLWNHSDYAKYKANFRFTFRHSVEHFYPQNPLENQPHLSDGVLHQFGNLCLVSSGINSKFSNNMPAAKFANFQHMLEQQSIKLRVMMEEAQNWHDEQIKQHGEKILAILNTRCS